MTYKGMTILELYTAFETWDGDKCIQTERPRLVAYIVEDLDDALLYEDLDEAKEAIDRATDRLLTIQ